VRYLGASMMRAWQFAKAQARRSSMTAGRRRAQIAAAVNLEQAPPLFKDKQVCLNE